MDVDEYGSKEHRRYPVADHSTIASHVAALKHVLPIPTADAMLQNMVLDVKPSALLVLPRALEQQDLPCLTVRRPPQPSSLSNSRLR